MVKVYSALALGTIVAAGGLAAPAEAKPKSPAPIVYGERAPTTTSTLPAASRVTAPITIETQTGSPTRDRIIFRYPGATEVPTSADPAPVRMAALDPEPPRAAMDATAAARPVITESFDLSAAPIRVAADTPSQATPSVAPRVAGQPLQLSRVRMTEGATLEEQVGQVGMYPTGLEGKPTANGEIFRPGDLTAAHPNLPLPSLVQVVNERTQQEIVVRVNDRGPFDGGRIMDLSPAAARALGVGQGQTASMRLRYLGPAPVRTVTEEAGPTEMATPPVVLAEQLEPSTSQPSMTAMSQAPARAQAVVRQASASAPLSVGRYFIQAGSFADIGNAQTLTQNLQGSLPVKIEEARVNNGDYFRVMVGPFASREQADRRRDELARAGIASGFVIAR